jgi:hypothetical protein
MRLYTNKANIQIKGRESDGLRLRRRSFVRMVLFRIPGDDMVSSLKVYAFSLSVNLANAGIMLCAADVLHVAKVHF